MVDIHESCLQYGKDENGYVDYVKGANIAGFVKVADAMLAQGVVWVVAIDKNDTVHAISIGFVKYGDSSLISTCYTLEYGTQSYMLKGILSKGRKKVSKSFLNHLIY